MDMTICDWKGQEENSKLVENVMADLEEEWMAMWSWSFLLLWILECLCITDQVPNGRKEKAS